MKLLIAALGFLSILMITPFVYAEQTFQECYNDTAKAVFTTFFNTHFKDFSSHLHLNDSEANHIKQFITDSCS